MKAHSGRPKPMCRVALCLFPLFAKERGLQIRQLHLDQERLEREATAQINAALQEGMAAANVARQEAVAGETSALQEAQDREAQMTASIASLQAEQEVRCQLHLDDWPVCLRLQQMQCPFLGEPTLSTEEGEPTQDVPPLHA